jgi:hypothetical protein
MAESVDELFRRVFDSLLERVQNEIRSHAEAAAQAERRTAEAVLQAQTQASHDTLSRLVTSVRALDDATALSQTLETLVSAVRPEARRAGLFLWRNDRLRAWGTAEFEAADGQPATDLKPDEAGVIADAVRTATPHLATSPDRWPAFAGVPANGVFAAVPLIMNGQVIAVLCADHDSMTEGTHLALTCELLARHAAQHLESLTARRLAQTGASQGVAAS